MMKDFVRTATVVVALYLFHTSTDYIYRAHCRKSIFHIAFFGNSRMCLVLEAGMKMAEGIVTTLFFANDKKMI